MAKFIVAEIINDDSSIYGYRVVNSQTEEVTDLNTEKVL
jgi:hypothetical protein